MCLQHSASSNSTSLPERMCEESIYPSYDVRMGQASTSLIGSLGRCCQKVPAASEMGFSYSVYAVLFDWGWEKEEKGIDCAF